MRVVYSSQLYILALKNVQKSGVYSLKMPIDQHIYLLGGSHFAFDTSSLRNLITHPRRQIEIELLMIIGIYTDEASIKLALIFSKKYLKIIVCT